MKLLSKQDFGGVPLFFRKCNGMAEYLSNVKVEGESQKMLSQTKVWWGEDLVQKITKNKIIWTSPEIWVGRWLWAECSLSKSPLVISAQSSPTTIAKTTSSCFSFHFDFSLTLFLHLAFQLDFSLTPSIHLALLCFSIWLFTAKFYSSCFSIGLFTASSSYVFTKARPSSHQNPCQSSYVEMVIKVHIFNCCLSTPPSHENLPFVLWNVDLSGSSWTAYESHFEALHQGSSWQRGSAGHSQESHESEKVVARILFAILLFGNQVERTNKPK